MKAGTFTRRTSDGRFWQGLSRALGAYLVILASVIASARAQANTPLAPPGSLARALDATNLVWKTGGDASWFDYTSSPFSRMPFGRSGNAAHSGPIAHNQESWVEAEVPSTGTLAFWWGVSSQADSDVLRFFVNGTEVAGISGGVWFEPHVLQVPAGTVRWVYSKDASGTNGLDRAWLDNVGYYPAVANAPPSIVNQPALIHSSGSSQVEVGVDAKLIVVATGAAPLSYQWFKDGKPLASMSGPVSILRGVSLAQAGSYQVVVSNPLGSVMSSGVSLSVSTRWLANAVDTAATLGLVWATGGEASWFAHTVDPSASDGTDSARSGGIGHDQMSWIESVVEGPRILSFRWKVSSEIGGDRLRFYLGGIEVTNISGEVGWREESFSVPVGPQRIRWEYTKNSAVNAGHDCGWLDQVSLVVPPLQRLTLGLDATNLVWRTGGNASWFDFTRWLNLDVVPHDNSDAARSGTITHNQESWLETDVSGPGTLAFWWGVSSQAAPDSLQFLANGTLVAAISGNVAWQPQVLQVPGGTLRWVYSKDGSGTEGLDRGWLDEVAFFPASGTQPAIVYQPRSQSVEAGTDAALMVIATGAAPLSHQWYRDGKPLANATEPVLNLREVAHEQSGSYSAVVSNPFGFIASASARLTVSSYWLTQALDANLVWATGGDKSWFALTVDPSAHDTRDSASNGLIGHNQASWIQTSIEGPGKVSFWWRVSSEQAADPLRFYVGGIQVTNISGEVGWRQESFAIPDGVQQVRWEYTKNGALSTGADRGWLDQVAFFSEGHAPPIRGVPESIDSPAIEDVVRAVGEVQTVRSPVIVTAPENLTVWEGASARFSVSATGTPTLAYQWFKDGKTISGESSAELLLSNVAASAAGQYAVTVSNVGGSVTSAPATLIVRPPQAGFLRIFLGKTTLDFEVTTDAGGRYLLEFTDALSAPKWRPLDLILGDGTVRTLQILRNGELQRFYRIRRE